MHGPGSTHDFALLPSPAAILFPPLLSLELQTHPTAQMKPSSPRPSLFTLTQAHPQGSEPERPAEAPAGTYLKQAGLGPGSGCGTEDPSWLCLAHPHQKPPGRRRGHLGVWGEFTIRDKWVGRVSQASPVSPWFFLSYLSSHQDSEGAP